MILYLHGLNSGGTAGKATALRDGLTPIPVISPTYPAHRPQQAVSELRRLLEKMEPPYERPMIIGSSMGGFYGQYLARQFPVMRLVMINPALRPWELLEGAVGEQTNFVTGEHYLLRHEDVQQTRQFAVEDVNDGVPTTLFLDRGDETIDYRIAAEIYRDIGELVIFEGGDHRFQHMAEAIGIIRERYHEGAV